MAAVANGLATMKDVAREVGVGVGTVSRVVNSTGSVSEKTRAKVLRAIERLSFNPNPIAQSMRLGLTKTFGCVVRDFNVPTLSKLVDSIQSIADGKNFGLQVASSYHDPAREIVLLRRLALRTDGIVVASSSETDPKLLATLREIGAAVVLNDRNEPAELDAVLLDHSYGVRAAIDHLMELGHKKIAILVGQPGLRPTEERLVGYRRAFKSRGEKVPENLIRTGSFSNEFAYSETALLLQRPDRPTAIFAGGTSMLGGVLLAVRDAGLRVPEDISLISGADSELALLNSPSITTVRWQYEQMGIAAANFLFNRLEVRTRPTQRMVFPTELVKRSSCGRVPNTKP